MVTRCKTHVHLIPSFPPSFASLPQSLVNYVIKKGAALSLTFLRRHAERVLTAGPAHPLFPTLLSDPFYTTFMAPRVLWYVQQHHLSSTREGGGKEERKGEVPAVLRLLKVDLAKAEASNPYPDYRANSSSLHSFPSFPSSSFFSSFSLRDAETGKDADEVASMQHVTKVVEEDMETKGGSESEKLASTTEATAMEEPLEYTKTLFIWRRVLLMFLGVCCCVGILVYYVVVWS